MKLQITASWTSHISKTICEHKDQKSKVCSDTEKMLRFSSQKHEKKSQKLQHCKSNLSYKFVRKHFKGNNNDIAVFNTEIQLRKPEKTSSIHHSLKNIQDLYNVSVTEVPDT